MKMSLFFSIAGALLIPLVEADASALKFDDADAAAAIEKSLAMFEAKPIEVSRVLRLKDGTVVTEQELKKLNHPSNESQTFNVANAAYEVTFEVTKVYKGDTKVGLQFSLKWSDLHGSMCPHLETRMVRGEGVWAIRKNSKGENEYKPYPQNTGDLLRKTFTKAKPGAAKGKAKTAGVSAVKAE